MKIKIREWKHHENSSNKTIRDPLVTKVEDYEGPYKITPLARKSVALKTKGKVMSGDVVVNKIPYYEIKNSKGITVVIAREVQ